MTSENSAQVTEDQAREDEFVHDVPKIMLAVLAAIRDEYDRVYWNQKQEDCPTPFSNNGTKLDTEIFSVHAYDWTDEQPWNFKWRDLRIQWYKHMSRGSYSNIPITPDMAAECLEECLGRIQAMEYDQDGNEIEELVDLT